jgi:hypothetical protein
MVSPKVVPPVRTLRAGALNRAVLTVDRGVVLRRIIPVPVMIALDERHLFMDAHLCYGESADEIVDLRGFKARALAYAAMTLSPSKARYLLDAVMPAEAIARDAALVPVTQFELNRAELFDAIQGGNRATLLGVRATDLRVAKKPLEYEPHMDHA